MENMDIYDPLADKIRPAWMVQAVDELLAKIKHMDIWEVCDFALSIWIQKNPKEGNAFLDDMKRYRATRKKETGATDNNSWRGLVSIPPEVSYLLRKLADHKIQEYGEHKFWRDFAKKYPAFAEMEKF